MEKHTGIARDHGRVEKDEATVASKRKATFDVNVVV